MHINKTINTLYFLLFCGCSESEAEPANQDIVQEVLPASENPSLKKDVVVETNQIAKPPPFPQRGEVLAKPMNMDECLGQFDACICDGVKTNSDCHPPYRYVIQELSPEIQAEMTGVSWHPDCPIPISELRMLRMLYWTPLNTIHWGELVVAESVTQQVSQIFKDLFEVRFPIERMERVDAYDGNDRASMEANNTSAFNCRNVGGTSAWSEHSYGLAIDINPLWNPWVKGEKVDPPSALAFVDRTTDHPGMIHPDGEVVRIFQSHGWHWGGKWSKANDYQHFSLKGR